MEEVDSIILHFLRQLNIDISEDVKTISDLPVELIVESAVKCITSINTSIKVPVKLPSNVSQRIEVAAQIASVCKDLGYQNDVGYQTFLYHNETELRQVFMFLIEKLPSEDKQTPTKVQPANQKLQLHQDISKKIASDMNTVWTPSCCKPSLHGSSEEDLTLNDQTACASSSSQEISEKIRKINEIKNKMVPPIGQNTRNVRQSKFKTDLSNLLFNNFNIDKTLKELKETSISLRQKLDTLQSERNVMDVELMQAEKNCERSEGDLANVQNILESLDFSEIDYDDLDVMEKIQEEISMLHRESEEITSKSLTLKVEIDKLETLKSLSQSKSTQYRNILLNLKENAKSIKDECEKKEELRDELKEKHEKLKGGNKRHVYTKRITEIIGNVDKQNEEIHKILDDTRQLQKEINSLEGQLDRCFSMADETLFKDAKRDDQAKKAYKLLALLHSECNTIVSLVNDTGVMYREIVDLEDNIKAEKSKRTEDILKKIQLDLAKLQNEN